MTFIRAKKPLDLISLKPEAQKEGFCLLYDATKKGPSFLAIKPTQKLKSVPRNLQKPVIGYLAYPNPTLRNEIPEGVFYEFEHIVEYIMPLLSLSEAATTSSQLQKDFQTSRPIQCNVTRMAYLRNIKNIKGLLAAGEVYQLNYAIRFRTRFEGDPYSLFLTLAQVNPAPFSSFIHCGDFQIVSASPERLFRVENGFIKTQPIKGTVSKSQDHKITRSQDPNLQQLINSEKERAELDMITDLERNDLGKVSEYGSVKVNQERAVLELPNLWHTYSEIEGRLKPGIGPTEILKALFPGGSVTGCPKVRTMRTIEELEGAPRNIFTGSIGYMGHRADHPPGPSPSLGGRAPQLVMDFNIAIRTILIRQGMLEFWVGGGIVADSDPEQEYAECLLKAERIFAILQ